ncbi:MAG: FHA domain-containing protein [Holophaga sp.]|nr:FHA domain-containing protein [Holophaga sp.]
MAKLLVQESTGVREFELVDNEIQLGRELDNSLRLADPSISRHHAVIRRTDSGYEVQDLQSSNGVLVNGTRVQTATLQDGDRVTLGQIQMTFVDPAAVQSFATTVVAAGEPVNPLGTMRMDANEMAKIQAMQPSAALPAPPPPPPLPVAPPVVALPEAQATSRNPVGEPRPFTYAAVTPDNPAPSFIRPYLPPVPDDARPTGERGDFVTRLLAHLIDVAILIVPFIALWIIQVILIGVLVRIMGPAVLALGCIFGLLQFAIGIGSLFFWVWCWIKFGATPGKKIMKLRVVPEGDPNGRIDVSMAVLRVLGHILNFGIGYLLILGEDRKGLQDILSKTIVIKVDR